MDGDASKTAYKRAKTKHRGEGKKKRGGKRREETLFSRSHPRNFHERDPGERKKERKEQ